MKIYFSITHDDPFFVKISIVNRYIVRLLKICGAMNILPKEG